MLRPRAFLIDPAGTLRAAGIPVATSGLPVDLVLVADSVPLGRSKRGLVTVQARPRPLDRLACVIEQDARVLSPTISLLPVLTTLDVDLVCQGVEPAFSLVRQQFPFVRHLVALVGETLALVGQFLTLLGANLPLVRRAIPAALSAVLGGQVAGLSRLVGHNRVGLRHLSTVRPLPSGTSKRGSTVRHQVAVGGSS